MKISTCTFSRVKPVRLSEAFLNSAVCAMKPTQLLAVMTRISGHSLSQMGSWSMYRSIFDGFTSVTLVPCPKSRSMVHQPVHGPISQRIRPFADSCPSIYSLMLSIFDSEWSQSLVFFLVSGRILAGGRSNPALLVSLGKQLTAFLTPPGS